MSQQMKRRVEAIEKQAGHREQKTFLVIEHADGTITGADLNEIRPEDMVMHVSSPPWDSEQRRMLTDDEMEAKYPGRRARLAQAQRALKGRGAILVDSLPEDIDL
jgi:hypothetical protein